MELIFGRAFLRSWREEGEPVRRVMILAVVQMPADALVDDADYAANLDGSVLSEDTLQMSLSKIEDITQHVPRGMNAMQILTSGIKALWERK